MDYLDGTIREFFEIFNSSSFINLSNTNTTELAKSLSQASGFIQEFLEALPIICIIGVVTNVINIAVFLNPRMQDRSFKFMLANSVSDCIYLIFFLTDYYILKAYCNDCEITKTYTAQMFFFLVDDYFSSVCAFFCILIDITMSLERLFIVTNKKLCSPPYLLIMFICSVASFLFYMPVLFLKEINPVKINQSNGTLAVQTYKTDITSYGKSISGKLVTTVLSVIRILLATVFLSIINIITAIKLKERLKRKMTYKNQTLRVVESTFERTAISTDKQKTNESMKVKRMRKLKNNKAERASRNITVVVMFTCFLYIFGTAPYVLAYILSFFYNNSMILTNYTTFSMGVLFLAHGVNFFVYIACNRLYRQVCLGYLKGPRNSS